MGKYTRDAQKGPTDGAGVLGPLKSFQSIMIRRKTAPKSFDEKENEQRVEKAYDKEFKTVIMNYEGKDNFASQSDASQSIKKTTY